jgi:bacterioferritin (cytochrome b1)
MSSNSLLISQLNALVRLTDMEVSLIEARRAQASTPAFELQLRDDAEQGRRRHQQLIDAIRRLDGVPDVVGMVAGRVNAMVKTSTDQAQDLTEALLGDLALEHQLLDRTRFAKMLAERDDDTATVRVLELIEPAHAARVEWLFTRLGEVSVGGPAALRPTPMQTVAGVSRRVSQFPIRQTAVTVNRSLKAANQLQQRTVEAVTTNVARARELAEAAGEIWAAGRDASLQRGEEVARERGARGTARRLHEAREELGALDASELPIRGYDGLSAEAAAGRISRLRDVDDVRAVLAYEEANKNRKTVTTAARERIEELAAELASVS